MRADARLAHRLEQQPVRPALRRRRARERGSTCGRARSGRPRRAATKREISIDRESSCRSSASSSASSTTTNWPFATSQPLHDLVRADLAVVLRAPALLLDRRQALPVQQPERDVRLPGSRLRRRRETDGDADEPEAQRSVPGRAHAPPVPLQAQSRRTGVILARFAVPAPDAIHRQTPAPRTTFSPMAAARTIARLWRDAVAARAHRVRVPRPARRPLARGHLGRGGGARRGHSRTASWRAASGRATPSRSSPARRSSGRCSTSRSPTSARSSCPIYANSSPKDVEYVLEHSRVGRRPLRGRRAAGQGRRAQALPRLRHVLTYDDLVALETEGRAYAAAAPGRARRGGRGDRRGGSLHVHLHVGDDRASEGLHDPPPQLLRDGLGRRRAARLRRRATT